MVGKKISGKVAPLAKWVSGANRTRSCRDDSAGVQTLLRASIAALATVLAATAVAERAGAVVGGSSISVKSAPWAVAVISTKRSRHDPIVCSGSILDASHILTAAHCLYPSAGKKRAPSTLVVRAGASNFITPATGDAPQDRRVRSFRVHPGFDATRLKRLGAQTPDDLAVLELVRPLDLTGPSARAISLQDPQTHEHSHSGSVAGFGRESTLVAPSGALRVMHPTIDPQGLCGFPAMAGQRTLLFFNAIERCAHAMRTATCYGDSGAGLVAAGDHPHLVGVLSGALWGNCVPGSRAIYTFLGAPEIRLFIEGRDDPPRAPRWSLELDGREPPRVGDAIACKSPGLKSSVRVRYTFMTVAGHILQSGPSSIYRIEHKAVGLQVICRAAATNAGGTTVAELRTGRIKAR